MLYNINQLIPVGNSARIPNEAELSNKTSNIFASLSHIYVYVHCQYHIYNKIYIH